MKSKQRIVVIGGGLSGLIAACNIKNTSKETDVVLIEKNSQLGGRLFKEKIKIGEIEAILNNGPSWYWMPDLIERVYKDIGILDSNIEKYKLQKLDPQYRIISNIDFVKRNINIPSNFNKIKQWIYIIEPLAINRLSCFLKYTFKFYGSLYDILRYPNISFSEYFNCDMFYYMYLIFSMNFPGSYRNYINTIFKNKFLRLLFEWPSLFIGSSPSNISSMFSFLTFTMIYHGTYVPTKSGMYDIIEYLEKYANHLGVKIIKNHSVEKINLEGNDIKSLNLIEHSENKCDKKIKEINTDYVINSSDYHFFESLLPELNRSYPEEYWKRQVLCPSCLIFNVIIDTKLDSLEFHNLFFDKDLDKHTELIYNKNTFSGEPLFYLNITTKLFDEISDKSYENLFILVPTNPHKILDNYSKEYIWGNIAKRLSEYSGVDIEKHIKFKREFCDDNFGKMFNAYGNNAYGLSCDKTQIGVLRPSIKSLYVRNLYYCGQMTTPGPGVPTTMISGLNASSLLLNDIRQRIKKRKEKIKKRWFNKVVRLTNTSLIFMMTLGIENISVVLKCIKKEIDYLF